MRAPKSYVIKRWLGVFPWTIALLYTAVASLAHPCFRLTFFGDFAQLSLATVLVAGCAANAIASRERARGFWSLMTIGSLFWLASQTVWSYYELWKQVAPPDPGLGGLLLFLHLAPMTAALFMMPHKRSGIPPLSALSMGMVFTWWLFLYSYLVVPWQYVNAQPAFYNEAFNTLYTIEDLFFIAILAVWAGRATGAWRKLYIQLLAGSIVYAAGSFVLDNLINQKNYFTGSLYDLLFVVPVAYIASVTADFLPIDSRNESELPLSRSDGRVGLLTVFALLSVPALLVWNEFSQVPAGVRGIRSVAGLVAIVVLSLLLFAKQYVLTARLSESLQASRSNVTQLSELREQLERKATHDSMTGLLNRSTVIMSLERELARAAREDCRVAALLLDLDHFKTINDNYGHHAGDTAIAFAAACMEMSVRSHDYVGRYGGEEFLIVVPDCDEMLARDIAERIRERVETEIVTFDGHVLPITATIGVALSDSAECSESLLRRADAALYHGKQRGRNSVVCATEGISSNDLRFA